MPQEEYSKNRLIFKSDPLAIDFGNVSIRNFPSISLASDVFDFYPYGELYFADSGSMIIDKLVFVEGLKIDFRIGNEEDGYVGHDFAWTESQINSTTIADFISGDNIFMMKSNYSNLDVVKSKVWGESTLSDVVSSIIQTDFSITDSDKINITATTGVDSWYQINSTNEMFLMNHREQAYSQNNPTSPYLTFINTNGDFYFSTIESLFNEQKPVASYKLQLKEDSVIDSESIKDYDIYFVGEPVNNLNYKKNTYTIDGTGVTETTTNLIETFFATSSKGKALIRQQLQEDISDYEFMGIQETTQDKYRQLGRRNFEFVDSALPIRQDIVVEFNPKCVSGKLIDLEVSSVFEDKQILSEFSGSWLIISDKHYMDKDANPVTMLSLAKSRVNIDSQHPFFGDFLT